MDRFVARRNIEHFSHQLETGRDPVKRSNIEKLLDEACEQLRQAEEAHQREAETRR
jgi:hypothetical protein